MALQLPHFSSQDSNFSPSQTGTIDLAGAIKNGIESYYRPSMVRAQIFNKEIGPVAALASSPNFTGFNPEIQRMIANRIGSYFGSPGQSGSDTTPGYASDKDIYDRLSTGAHSAFGHGGKINTISSQIAGKADQLGLPHWLTSMLGGSGAAGANAAYGQSMQEGIQRLRMKGYSEQAARQALAHQEGESDVDYNERIRPLFISGQQQSNTVTPASVSTGNSSTQDDNLFKTAEEASQRILKEHGVDVAPTVLFDAFSKHKGGKFNMPKWLKSRGYIK